MSPLSCWLSLCFAMSCLVVDAARGRRAAVDHLRLSRWPSACLPSSISSRVRWPPLWPPISPPLWPASRTLMSPLSCWLPPACLPWLPGFFCWVIVGSPAAGPSVRALLALVRFDLAAAVDQFAHAQAALAACLAHAELAAGAVDRAVGGVVGLVAGGLTAWGLLPAHGLSP